MTDTDKPRLLVMTDIGGDPDDEQSLVRLLVHADLFDLEGIVPDRWVGHSGRFGDLTDSSQLDIVRDAVSRYATVVDRLRTHSPAFPSPDHLLSVLKRGAVDIPTPKHEGELVDVSDLVGPGRACEGADWIISCVDREDPRPLDICIWGGSATLAQALWTVREGRSPEELARFFGKIRVHAIGDQDDTGPWIRHQFPELFYILDSAPDGSKLNSCYRGMFLDGDESLTSRRWIDEHVLTGHGPLGEWYPTETWTASNPNGCLKEGDTPSWFYFLPNGLQDPGSPEAGGWGGRFVQTGTHFQDAMDEVDGDTSHRATVWRWRPAFQNHFASRMDWCVHDVGDANHAPRAVVNGANGTAFVSLEAREGDVVTLDASESTDPDGDSLSFRWWSYGEAGTCTRPVSIEGDGSPEARVNVPRGSAGSDIHVVLEVTDDGTPALTSYRRAVVRVR